MPTSEAGTGTADADSSTSNPPPSPTPCALVTMPPAALSPPPEPSPVLVRISTTEGSTRAMALTNAPSSAATAGGPDAGPVWAPSDPEAAHPESGAATTTTAAASAPPRAPVSIGGRPGPAGGTGTVASIRFAGIGSPSDVTEVSEVLDGTELRGTCRLGGQGMPRARPGDFPASCTAAS